MPADEVHLRGPYSEIREVKQCLTVYSIDAKVVRKNNETHVFFSRSDPAVNELCSSLDTSWTLCVGCDLCSRSKAVRKTHSKAALYPPLILLPTSSDPTIEDAHSVLLQHPGYTHVAVNAPIKVGDPVRRPKIEPLIGDFGEFTASPTPTAEDFADAFWCTCIQNGIFQTWAPMYTMFSRGNITEKKRVLDQFALQAPIKDTTVVDLYAGIGYFTLSYAKNHPRVIYCWELNWWSVEGLLRAAKENKLKARSIQQGELYVPEEGDCIVIFVEDNQCALQRMHTLDVTNLSHVNMGLLPDCHDAFPVALELEKRSRTPPVFHIHENIRVVDMEKWTSETSQHFGRCLHVERIKNYSPGVIHVCGDFSR